MGILITEVMSISCSASTAFDLMADARNELRWNSGVSRVELASDGPIGKGSWFRVTDKRGQHEVEITAYQRPEALSFSVTSREMDVLIDFTLKERDNVTTMAGRFSAEGKGLMRFLLPLLVPFIRRDLSKEHKNFVKLCEAED